MSFVIRKAPEGFGSRLAIHSLPNTDTAVEGVYTRLIKSTGQITKGSAIHFEVTNTSPDYISTKEFRLLMKLQILNDSGNPVTNTDNVTFINYPIASVIRQIDFAIQQQQISTGVGPNYPIKAYLDIITKTGKSLQSTLLKGGLFAKDIAGVLDSYTPIATPNTGLEERYNRTKTGQPLQLEQKLFLDFCECDKELINNVPLSIKLYPSTDKFALMYPTPVNPGEGDVKYYTFNIVDATLAIDFIKVNPGILVLHAKELREDPAVYTFSDSQIRAHNIPAQSYDVSFNNIFTDKVPEELLVVLIASQSYNGHNQRTPFNCAHYSLTYIEFKVDSYSNEANVMTPDFVQGNYAGAYSKLFKDLEKQREIPDISWLDFQSGYCIFKFYLSQHNKSKNQTSVVRRGQTHATLRFQNPLPEPVTVIFYGKFLGMVVIDDVRNVTVPQ